MFAPHLRRGSTGENLARYFLEGKGYHILHCNWKTRKGELDLVCEKKGQLIFVEVKTRSSQEKGEPGEAIDHKKRRRLINAAKAYLSRHNLWHRPCRFDLVAIFISHYQCSLEHIHNVIQFPQALGSGYTYWQPW